MLYQRIHLFYFFHHTLQSIAIYKPNFLLELYFLPFHFANIIPSLGVGCAYVGVSAKFCFAKTAITGILHKNKQISTDYLKDKSGSYYLIFLLINWVDVFTCKIYRDINLESLDYSRRKRDYKFEVS